jgi:hypothetical protein
MTSTTQLADLPDEALDGVLAVTVTSGDPRAAVALACSNKDFAGRLHRLLASGGHLAAAVEDLDRPPPLEEDTLADSLGGVLLPGSAAGNAETARLKHAGERTLGYERELAPEMAAALLPETYRTWQELAAALDCAFGGGL